MNLNLIVLYVADLEESRRFYQLLGLDLVQEQHGETGPVHYAATIDGTVLELYPAGDRPPTKVRLGFAVPDPAGTAERLTAAGYAVRGVVAVDPDGNRVALEPEPWDGFSELPEWMCEEPDAAEKARIAALFADPDRPVIRTGVEYPADSPQGQLLAEWRAAGEERVLRQWVRPGDAGTEAERRVAALRRMAEWAAERLEEGENERHV